MNLHYLTTIPLNVNFFAEMVLEWTFWKISAIFLFVKFITFPFVRVIPFCHAYHFLNKLQSTLPEDTYIHINISFFWNYGFPKKCFLWSQQICNTSSLFDFHRLQNPLPEGPFSKVFMNLVKWFRRKKVNAKVYGRTDRQLLKKSCF